MKKIFVLGMGVCMVFALSSCKSSKQSAYKKAYEKAQQQELASASEQTAPVEVVAPVQAVTPVEPAQPKVVEAAPAGTRQEKVTVVSGGDQLKRFSVVSGAYGIKANAEGVKQQLQNDGYNAMVVFNAERNLYRVVVSTFDDRASAEQSRDSFKARYPQNADFQKAWLLYNVE